MKILLVGSKTVKDYSGAKTQYLFNALTTAGANVEIYDVHSSTSIPRGVTKTIYLPWVESVDKTWSKFLKIIPGRRFLYTDNWYWYDQTSGNMLAKQDVNLDEVFHVVGFSTPENARWWPKGKFEWWGVLVDEDLAVPRQDQGYVWVDELWPRAWCDEIYTALDVLDLAIPIIKDRFGVSVLSQTPKDPDAPRPRWIDELVPRDQDVEHMLAVVAGARAFFTSHHECLGLMQFEAMTCGVPVVTNPTMSKEETFMAGDAAQAWSWDADESKKEYVDAEKAAARMVEAFERAMAVSRSAIREQAVARFGKKAFVDRTKLHE